MDEYDGFEDEEACDEDEMIGVHPQDYGLCPHGVTDDGECEECCGGPEGWPDDGW